VDCMETKATPISDVKSHNLMMNMLHATNIALRLNRPLTFDPATLRFLNDPIADLHVSRKSRAGYEIGSKKA
jgi:hypothetical protein